MLLIDVHTNPSFIGGKSSCKHDLPDDALVVAGRLVLLLSVVDEALE